MRKHQELHTGKRKLFFVSCLRALAACLITNAHYTGIYPTDLIASGGLIGDIIFFAVSGYCLYNVREAFSRWYGKRLLRCYLPVLLITAVYMLLGAYSPTEHPLLWWYVYPTAYHFVASVVVLYIPYYAVMKISALREHLTAVMVVLALIYGAVYVLFYDASYYHIDAVREPMIRFLFLESMLLGAWFRQREVHFRGHVSPWMPVAVVAAAAAYFASKLLFSRQERWSEGQIINQLLIFVLLYTVFRLFAALDGKLERLPELVRRGVSGLAEITLELYVVQVVLIDRLRSLWGFPVNWFVVTAAILAVATGLHLASRGIMKGLFALVKTIRRRRAARQE